MLHFNANRVNNSTVLTNILRINWRYKINGSGNSNAELARIKVTAFRNCNSNHDSLFGRKPWKAVIYDTVFSDSGTIPKRKRLQYNNNDDLFYIAYY